MTKNITWGIKFESLIEVVGGRFTYFGMNMNIKIRIKGIITPIIEYTSGLEELLQAKHHTTLNTIAMIIMNVPIPIPNILPDVFWQLAYIMSKIANKICLKLIKMFFIFLLEFF